MYLVNEGVARPMFAFTTPKQKVAASITVGNGVQYAVETDSGLPDHILAAAQDNQEELVGMRRIFESRLASSAKMKLIGEARSAEHAGLRTVHGYLDSLSKAPRGFDAGMALKAQHVLDQTFPEGIAFLNEPQAEVSGQVDRCILRIETDHTPAIIDLGGRIVINMLTAAHKQYIVALSAPGIDAEDSKSLIDAQDRFFNTLGVLYMYVAGWVQQEPQHLERGLRILRPIHTVDGMVRQNREAKAARNAKPADDDTASPSPTPETPTNDDGVVTDDAPVSDENEPSEEASPVNDETATEAEVNEGSENVDTSSTEAAESKSA